MDPGLNQLLKWSVQNSDPARQEQASTVPPAGPAPNAEALNALFGGPSDAELMKEAIAVVTSPTAELADKLIAFDNFEQLVESMDNANNMAKLDLWAPLVSQLQHEEAELRKMAAWCVGTAVQNNIMAQEHALSQRVVPMLVALLQDDRDLGVRRKAVYALSSMVRNYQPALDAVTDALPSDVLGGDVGKTSIDATDMQAVDRLMTILRERAQGG
jgi:hypothetical protein